MKKLLFVIILLGQVYSQSFDATLTLYKDGYGLVKQSIQFEVNPGRNSIHYSSLPDKIEPKSPFLSLQGADVIFQKYNHDLFDTFGFLKDHLGSKVKIKSVLGGSFKGRLINVDRKWLTVKRPGSIRIVNLDEVVNISISKYKSILPVRPELIWDVRSSKKGDITGELIYISGGFDWDANYRLIILPEEKSGQLASVAVVKNETDLSFFETKLELIEGDLRRLPGRQLSRMQTMRSRSVPGVEREQAVTFERESLGDYYFYTLEEKLSFPRKEAITVSLHPEKQIKFSRLYLFENRERSSREAPLTVQLSFENTQKNNLGIPLPGGSLQIYNSTKEGAIKFAGEDFLPQVAAGETATFIAGRAFDVLGQRTVVNYDGKKKSEEVTIMLEIKNLRKDKIAVQLTEHILGVWVIQDPSHQYRKVDAQTVQFDLSLPAGSTERVIYTYRKEWQ